MAYRILVLVLGLFWLAAASAASAEPRIALVIGNGAYGGTIGNLTNPPNDARLIAKALTDAGFKVNLVLNADQKQMKRAVVDFGQTLAAAGSDAVGLFYYAGHGVQVNGKNYLIPTKAEIQGQADVDIESVDADTVMQQMEFAGNRMNIVILDACRNNPLPAASRSTGGGLARVDAPTGSFIAYSTAPGQTAADGDGKNSPYSKALADAIENQRVPLEQLFRDVRVNVMNATEKKQVPWDSSSLTGEFYFKAPNGAAPSTTPQLASVAPAPSTSTASGAAGGDAAKASAEPGKVIRDCTDCPELVTLPGGKYQMGASVSDDNRNDNELPAHEVTLKPFALMTAEVTRDQFAAFVKATDRDMSGGCYLADGGDGKWDDNADYMHVDFQQKGNEPVICVSWGDATDYADWLSDKTGKHYRLVTEAEFEYASRAGKKTIWAWGDGNVESACRFANTMDQSGHKKYPINEASKCDDGFVATAPVGSFPANAFGLKDMTGNVWEWVEDCYHESYKGAPKDGSAWETDDCKERVARGGAWLENVWDNRIARRYNVDHTGRETILGFRVARDLD